MLDSRENIRRTWRGIFEKSGSGNQPGQFHGELIQREGDVRVWGVWRLLSVWDTNGQCDQKQKGDSGRRGLGGRRCARSK